jgi:hypothetical protein
MIWAALGVVSGVGWQLLKLWWAQKVEQWDRHAEMVAEMYCENWPGS